jgi:diaminopimelate epimerase
MVYFNSDGRESTMCGNGGRCLAAFAKDLEIPGDHYRFLAVDGPHLAVVQQKAAGDYWIELKMSDVHAVEHRQDDFVLNTGSPHYVRFVPTLETVDMVTEGRAVRYNDEFRAAGINVNLVQCEAGSLHIRTYERGVEDETPACGTGVTAAALAFALRTDFPEGAAEVPVHARGGDLSVRFHVGPRGSVTEIWLCGPAKRVFQGQITL